MKILVTGRGGQLASEFEFFRKTDSSWIFKSIEDLNILDNVKLDYFFNHNKIDFIINCAAYTAVDRAEDEIEKCFQVNVKGVENLVRVCQKFKIKLIHYSTDYVFDGESSVPYCENSITNPRTVYGNSKLEGEYIVRNSNIKSIIIRTSWVYSRFGNNFIKIMLKLAEKQKIINVVNDQVGSPTHAKDLAIVTMKIINNSNYGWKVGGELFHFSNEQSCTWYEFAKKIFEIKNITIQVNPISTSSYPTKANRPKYSLLDKTKIKSIFKIKIKDWAESLDEMLSTYEK